MRVLPVLRMAPGDLGGAREQGRCFVKAVSVIDPCANPLCGHARSVHWNGRGRCSAPNDRDRVQHSCCCSGWCKPKARKPSRGDLLLVIGLLQRLIDDARAANMNDRDPDRWKKISALLETAFNLCIETTAHDPSEASDPNARSRS